MPEPTSKPLFFAPADSALREKAGGLLGAAGVRLQTDMSTEVDLALVDLTTARGEAVLRELQDRWPRLAVFAIAEPKAAVDAMVLETISPSCLDAELVTRLGRLRSRLGTMQDAQLQRRDLQALLELTARYAEATDIDELLHDVTRRLAEDMAIDRAALVVVDAERKGAVIVAASDDPSLKDLPLDLARYPEIREVVRTGKPVILEDAPSHPLLEDVKEAVTARNIRNIAALPLSVGGKVLGVLLLRRGSEGGAFKPREVDFLATVAHATAIAFRNVRRLESVRGQREKEKSARIAAEERAEELKRYEAYFEHLTDGIAVLDSRACILSLNKAGLRMLDVEPTEAIGRHVNALTNPSDDGLLLDVLYSVSQGQVRTDVDLHAKTVAGRKVTLSIAAAPLGGEAEGVAILALRDVTRHRAMAEELRGTKEFLERLIDSSVDAIIAVNMKGTVILFNKAAEAITGQVATEVIGKLPVGRIYADPATPYEVMKKLRSPDFGGPGRLTTTRVEIISRANERIPVNMTATILYEGGAEVATVGIFSDLRDRISLERKLSDAETRLLESEKSAVLVALAGTAAHELNQPLTSVMGYAELLKRKLKETDPSYRPVDIIHREAERMAEIVRKIGKITRYETQSYVGQAKIIDLNKAASNEE